MTDKKDLNEIDELEREILEAAEKYRQEGGRKVGYQEHQLSELARISGQVDENIRQMNEDEGYIPDIDIYMEKLKRNWGGD